MWAPRTLRDSPLLPLVTSAGDVDLLPTVPGVGDDAAVAARSEPVVLFGHRIRVLTLDALTDVKRAMDRPKDRLLLAHLDALRGL